MKGFETEINLKKRFAAEDCWRNMTDTTTTTSNTTGNTCVSSVRSIIFTLA